MKKGGNIKKTCEEKVKEFLETPKVDFIEKNIKFYTKYSKSLKELELLKKA